MSISLKTLIGPLALVAGGTLLAQSNLTLSSIGYSDPKLLRVAPGQVTTLFITGAKTVLSGVQTAAQLPLPTTLGGFSAAITQQPGPGPEALPIFSVEQVNNCAETAATPDCIVTAITVQIPYNLLLNVGQSPFSRATSITISEDNVPSSSFSVQLNAQNIHILMACDATNPTRVQSYFAENCGNVITHIDGSLVTNVNPATAGETLVMYAFGLGVPVQAVTTGAASPSVANAAQGNYSLNFAYDPASSTAVLNSQQGPSPSYIGLVPGQVGLYQLNFIVPVPWSATTDCSSSGDNLTIALLSDVSPSVGTARLCVGFPQNPANKIPVKTLASSKVNR